MAHPVVLGAVFIPDPPNAGSPFAIKSAVDDADLAAAQKRISLMGFDADGTQFSGVLAPDQEVLTTVVAPGSPADPSVTPDQIDPNLHHGTAPATAGPATLSYDLVVTDLAGNASAPYRITSQPIVYPVTPPTPGPLPPPTDKALVWEAKSDFNGRGDLTPFTTTANPNPVGNQWTKLVDAPPESGMAGKVLQIEYTGAKDTNRSVSFRPPHGQCQTHGDLMVSDFILTIPNPLPGDNAGRKILYYQPHGNGPNHFVFAGGYGQKAADGAGHAEVTFSARTLPTPDKPNGKLQRLRIGFTYGHRQRCVVRLQTNSAPDKEDGYLELYTGDPEDWANARYSRLDNVLAMPDADDPIRDHRVGQQVNDNDSAYSELRWFESITLQLYR